MNHKKTYRRSHRSILRTAMSILLVLVLFGTSIPLYPSLKVEKASASTNLRIEPSEINPELGETTTISFSFNAADKGQEEHDIKINLAIPGANGGVPQLKELITSGTFKTKNAQGEYIVHEVEWDGTINGQPLPEGRYYIAISPADYNGIGVYYGQIGSFEIVNSKQPSPPASIEIEAGSGGQVVVSGTSEPASVVELEVRDQSGALMNTYDKITVNKQGQWSKSVALDANKIFQLSARSHKDGLSSSYSLIQEVMRYTVPAFPVTWGELAAYYYKANSSHQVEQKVADIAAWNGLNALSQAATVTGNSILLLNPQVDRLMQQGDRAQFTAEAIEARLNIVNPMWNGYVDPARGDFSYYTDELYLQAIMPLSFGLSYLSRNEHVGSAGLGWLHSYDWKLTDVDGKQQLLQPDGSHFEFIPLADGAYLSPRGTDWTLKKSGSGHVLTDLQGTSYQFNASGLLTSITDTNRNRVTLEYGDERLSKVSTNGASLTLSYNAEGRLSSVSDHTGRSLSYQYNADGDMIAFTDVDKAVTSFTYDHEHHVIAVTDPAQTAEMRITYDDHMRVIDFTDYYGNAERVEYEGEVAPVVGDEATEPEEPSQPTGPISIHPSNARDIPESDIVILSGSMNNIHNAPPYKHVPGLKPVITDYLASLSTDIMNAIEAYKKQAGSQASSIDQLQQQIAASSGQEAVVVRAGYLSVEEDVTFGSPTKPVIVMADGINTNKEVALTVYGNLILENGLNGNTKLNVHVNRVNQSYGNLWAKSTIHLNNDSNVKVADTLYAGALTYNSGTLAVDADQLIVQGDLSINTEVEMNIAGQMVLGGIVSNNLVANLNIKGGDLFVRDQVSVNNQMSVKAGGVFAIGGDMTANKTPIIHIGVGNGRTILKYPDDGAAGQGVVSALAMQSLLEVASAAAGGTDVLTQSGKISPTIATISETKRTNALQHTTTYVWGHQFVLSELKSPDGSSIKFAYDDNARIAQVVDGNGYRSQYAYDARGNQLQSIDGHGESVVARYNEQNRPVEIVDALGQLTAYKYDSSGNLIGGVDALGQQWKTERDAHGVPTQITNERGDTTRYVNNSAGFAEKIIDPSGYEITLIRDELNRVTEVRDSEGVINEMSYDAKDRATAMTDALQQTLQRMYDANGNLVSVIDQSGALTTYDYDVFRHIATTDALGEQTRFEYDAVGNLVEAIDPKGGTSSYHYDSLGRVVEETDPDGHTINYTYDSVGNQLTDGEGNTTAYTYNALGQVLTITDALGAATHYRYDANGQLTKETNALGNSTWYEYDELGRLTTVIDALGGKTSYSYDESGNLLTTTDAEGNVWKTEYDERGYAVASIDPLNRKTQYDIDERGRLMQYIDAEGNMTAYEYDELDRTTKVINALGHKTAYSYNALGQVVEMLDAKQQATTYEYDALGQLISVTDALGNQFSYSYDAVGNLLTKTNAKGAVTSYSYTPAGLLESRVNPLMETTSLRYDTNGNMVARIEPDGTTTNYSYDEVGRIVSISYDDGEQVEYHYDMLGRRMTMEDSNGITRYTYDALNRPTEIIDPRGQNVRYEWTVNSQRSRIIYPDNKSVRYTYDAAGQIQNVTDGLGQQTSYAYDNNGRVKQRMLPTGAVSSYSYDALGQIEQIKHQTAAGQLLEQLRYSYDEVGNVIRKERQEQGSDEDRPNNEAKPATVEQYAYNALNQLVEVEDTDGNFTQYSYDEIGNRLQAIRSEQGLTIVESYTYDLADKLLHWDNEVEFKDYSYDLRGNLIQVSGSSSLAQQLDLSSLLIAEPELEEQETNLEEEQANLDGSHDLEEQDRDEATSEQAVEDAQEAAEAADAVDAGDEEQSSTTEAEASSEGEQAAEEVQEASEATSEPAHDLAVASVEIAAATEEQQVADEAQEEQLNNEKQGATDEALDAVRDPLDELTDRLDSITGVYPSLDGSDDFTNLLDGPLDQANLANASGSVVLETYQWDAANRLIHQVNAAGDTTSYRYDGDNNRVYMGVAVGSSSTQVSYPSGHPAGARKGWEPQYKKQQLDIYFTNDTTTALPQPLYATDESGTGWKQSYVYGVHDERISMSYLPSADESTDWEPVAGESGAAPNTTPETLYYLEDSLDSVLALLNNDDEVALRYHYDAFGVATDAEKFDLNYPGPDNLFGYTGLGYDASSGLSYARARYFDSSIGRFISQDTYEGELNNPLSLNLYTYVHNNPLKYVDPSGHWIDIVIDIGFIIYDIGKIVVNPTNPTNWYALGADVAGALTPGGTGFGMAVRGLDNASDLAKKLSKLSKKERIAAVGGGKIVMPYKDLKKVTKGTGLEAHHLIEKRFAKQLGIKKNDILSIALDKDTHAKITELYRKYLPYNKTKNARVTTSNATKQQIWDATKKVYTEMKMTEYLELLKPYFKGVKY